MNTNGYRPSHRNRFFLIEHGVLTKEEFILWEYYLDQMGFDRKNKWFGKVEVNLEKIAAVLGYSNRPPYNSIRTKHKKLVKLGMLTPTEKSDIFEIYNADRYIPTTDKWQGQASQFQKSEFDQPFEQIIQNIAPNFQITEQKVQPFEQIARDCLEIDPPRALSSSKVNSSVNKPLVNQGSDEKVVAHKHTDKDRQKIYEDNEIYQGVFFPDDMKWLDDHFDFQGRYIP